MQFQSLTITEESEGKRLDAFCASELGLARNQIQRLIAEGHIRLNSESTKKTGIKLKAGDKIHYRLPEAKDSKVEAEDIPLEIIFEDKDLIVINKAPGIVVHPDESGHDSGTIVNAVLAHAKNLSGIGGEKRPGIVHRLDKDTSGVLLIAKNDKSHQKLSKLFQDRKIEKNYIALVKGHLKTKTGTIDAAIKRGRTNRQQMAIHAQGKRAITHFETLLTFKSATLLKVNIETGRTHQIRLHLASIGHPVIGDSTYGESKINKEFEKKYGLKRQFLHAESIKFGKKHYKAPLWEDLESVLEQLKQL